MASIEETSGSTVIDGANPDSVKVDPRLWRLSPLRDRDPADPIFTDAGLDVFLFGDPDADGDPVTVAGVTPGIRNGLKRVYDPSGNVTLWAEPSPQTFDTGGSISGTLGGSTTGAAGGAGDVSALGVQADHDYTNAGTYPIVIRPVITVASARMETALATLQAVVTFDNDGEVSQVTRDLFYAYGGSTTLVFGAQTIAPGAVFDVEVDFQMTYRDEITESFEVAIGAAQVVFQVTEYSSTGI